MTKLEPGTYTLSHSFSHELLVPVTNPSSPIALCTGCRCATIQRPLEDLRLEAGTCVMVMGSAMAGILTGMLIFIHYELCLLNVQCLISYSLFKVLKFLYFKDKTLRLSFMVASAQTFILIVLYYINMYYYILLHYITLCILQVALYIYNGPRFYCSLHRRRPVG